MTGELNRTWPNGKRVAVAVAVMYETWSEGKAPAYSVQTTHLKPGTADLAGHAWSTYGGRVGVWRLIRTLDRLQVPATFFTNARCAELYPDSVKQIVKSGHHVAGHNYTQDELLAYLTPEQEQATIRKCVDVLGTVSGHQPHGWLSSVLAFTERTAGFLAAEGLKWHGDVTYVDLPHRIATPHGPIVGIPGTDFSDIRVLRSSPRDFWDVYKGTFDYLQRHEPMSMLVLTLHCQFAGRPLFTAMLDEVIQYFRQQPDVWFARYDELAEWALAAKDDEHTYQSRYF
jgi:peptidoglycan/xylan/chitin deacetylase (PgdA/CDA1 family)